MNGELFSFANIEQPLSISEYIAQLNERLGGCEARIIGEVSQLTVSSRGHAYFSLKDKNDGSVINCVIWKSRYEVMGVALHEGLELVATGAPDIYAARGELKFVSHTLELFGEGALKKAYEALKATLFEEGLLAPERKRFLPAFPRRIGIITSREGAVIHDFLNNIGQYGFEIRLIHSIVEGKEAVMPLLKALAAMKRQTIDVLVVMRGGGSLESLQAFNNEHIVRAIAASPAPVIAAIGHHNDAPLAALAADCALSTPTAAAHALNESWDEAIFNLRQLQHTILSIFKNTLEDRRQFLAETQSVIIGRCKQSLVSASHTMQLVQEHIRLNDPRRQLKLGFSIARVGDTVVRSINQTSIGADLDIQVADGIINTRVQHTNRS